MILWSGDLVLKWVLLIGQHSSQNKWHQRKRRMEFEREETKSVNIISCALAAG